MPLTLYDFGDAADSFGTTLASGGAAHLGIGPQLGSLRDEEIDAVVGAAGQSADDDGLVSYALKRGKTSSVTASVLAPAGTAKLDAWVDFDHDGRFAPIEKIINSQTVAPGQTQITFAVPATSQLGPATARFRISTAGGLGPTGRADDGVRVFPGLALTSGRSPKS